MIRRQERLSSAEYGYYDDVIFFKHENGIVNRNLVLPDEYSNNYIGLNVLWMCAMQVTEHTRFGLQGLNCKVWTARFGLQGLDCKVWTARFGLQGLDCKVCTYAIQKHLIAAVAHSFAK